MRIAINDRGAVDCRATLEVPLPAISVWGQIRDFASYARQDFFHVNPTVAGGVPRPGAEIILYHRYMGLRFRRVGRILVWREGVGYSFSDLSERGPRAGFPHVFSYRIEPAGSAACRLQIRVRGLWTARTVPRLLARAWLWWVFAHVVRSVENRVLAYRIWRKRRERQVRRSGT